MDVSEAIRNRCVVRQFKTEIIPESDDSKRKKLNDLIFHERYGKVDYND
jgi:hypothetical protein